MSDELDRWERQVPRLVSMLGSVGLGLGLAYFVGFGVFLWPGAKAWGSFFLTWGPMLAAIPAVALGGHLYARMHLGGWLLARGAPDRAIAYTEDRLERGLLQGAREVGYHRLYRARAHLAKGAYAPARDLLEEEIPDPSRGALALRHQRWRCELALRERDGKRCRQAVEAVDDLAKPAEARAALAACRAEQAVLDEEFDTYQSWLDEARWSEASNWRVDLTEVFGGAVFERGAEPVDELLEMFDRAEERANRQIPGRRAECLARRATLLARDGRDARARETIERAVDDDRADERSRAVVAEVDERLSRQTGDSADS